MSEQVKELRRQVKALVDKQPLDKLYRILEVIEEEDEEEEMPEELAKILDRALAQADRGELIPHEEVMKKIRQRLKK
jgi:predicted transcriptional regulator